MSIVKLGKNPLNKLSHSLDFVILLHYLNPIFILYLFHKIHQLSKDMFEFYLISYYFQVYFFTSLGLPKYYFEYSI